MSDNNEKIMHQNVDEKPSVSSQEKVDGIALRDTNDLKHILPNFAEVALLDDQSRIQHIRQPRWIGYSKAKEVTDTLMTLYNYPVQDRMPNLLLIGEPNNGKTSLLKRFHSQMGEAVIVNDEVVKPVIYMQAPPSGSEKDLYLSLVGAYNGIVSHTATVAQARFQAMHHIRYFKTRLVIIDEIHSLLAGSPKQQRIIMNAIKFLCNDLNISFVLAGTKSALQVLHTDPQHASRFDVIELPLWHMDKEFARLVRSFERTLPLKEPSGLTQPEKLSAIFEMSKGCIGFTKRFIADCAIQAIERGGEKIELRDIKQLRWSFSKNNGIVIYN